MLGFSIVMFLVAALFTAVAIGIYRGQTDLIHDYHQTNVTDKAAYGKAFAKSFAIFPITMTCSGILSFLSAPFGVTVLIIGFVAGIIGFVKVQKRYNGGIFG